MAAAGTDYAWIAPTTTMTDRFRGEALNDWQIGQMLSTVTTQFSVLTGAGGHSKMKHNPNNQPINHSHDLLDVRLRRAPPQRVHPIPFVTYHAVSPRVDPAAPPRLVDLRADCPD